MVHKVTTGSWMVKMYRQNCVFFERQAYMIAILVSITLYRGQHFKKKVYKTSYYAGIVGITLTIKNLNFLV